MTVTVACGGQSYVEPTPIQYRTPTALASVKRTAKEEPRTATPTLSTATPTPTIVVASTKWSAQLTEGELNAVLELAGWPGELWAEARAVAWCESRWQPAATNGFSYGLFQVVPLWFDYSGLPFDAWADPVTNARAALGAYRYSNGWGQWVCQP